MRKILALTAASGLALTSLVALAPAASAKDGDMKRTNSCTGDSFSVVKVRDRKGGLRTDFYVKNNTVGQTWSFTLTQGGTTVSTASKVTRASDDDSSSDDDSRHTAEVKFRTYLSSAAGTLVFTATKGTETCSMTVTL
jgi:hypothetical protein